MPAPALIEKSKLTPEQFAEYQTRVIAARELLAAWDPCGEPMEIMAVAGFYNCKVSGETPTGMRFSSEGGVPKPKRRKR